MTNVVNYRAWAFEFPAPETSGAGDGIGLGATGSIRMVEGDASVRQAILMLLATEPGERVMRVDYGCHLNRIVFLPNDETTAGLAIHYVRQALARWEPRIDQVQVDAGPDQDDAGRLDLFVRYRVRATQRTDEILFPVQLQGEPI